MPRNRLQELREDQGLSQDQLAQKLDPPVNASTISKWETGVHDIPDSRKQELAELFGCSVIHLMGWDRPNGDDDGEAA